MGTLSTLPPAPAERGRRRYNRVVAFGLSGEEWDTLTEWAISEARDPAQQARWIVLQALKVFAAEAAS